MAASQVWRSLAAQNSSVSVCVGGRKDCVEQQPRLELPAQDSYAKVFMA